MNNKTFRSFFTLLLAGSLILTACGSGSSSTVSSSASASTETSVSEASVSEVSVSETVSTEVSSSEEVSAEPVQNSDNDCQAILDKGLFLFSGGTDEGYYPSDWKDWLTSASENDILALVYACDDTTHGGWGVLGLSVTGSAGRVQEDISAYPDEPDKERLTTYTIKDLMEMAEITTPADFTGFDLGAWNGGRIAGLYYLSGSVAEEMNAYLEGSSPAATIDHEYGGNLSNPNASAEADAVYEYIKSVWGSGCITGQMESTWMGSPDYEMNYIEENTGKLPAIRGLDFMNNDFSGVVTRAKAWWEKGGIVTINWHTGADFASGYNECLSDDIDWDEAFTEGSATYQALIDGMDRAVPYLQELEDAGVPVLWRPFHEFDGKWFWWGKGGADNFVKLWQLMYDRYTNYWGLDNLIWVLGYSSTGKEMEKWYPGDAYVDLIGADSYTDGANNKLYDKVAEIAPEGMPIVFHECGKIPTEAELTKKSTNWTYFMTWHTNYITDENDVEDLKEIYNSDYFITLDELPSFQ